MDRRPQLHRRDVDESGVDISRLLVFAFVVAALLGLGTGVLWIAWNLIGIHVLGWGS
jgi:hypothetical protein